MLEAHASQKPERPDAGDGCAADDGLTVLEELSRSLARAWKFVAAFETQVAAEAQMAVPAGDVKGHIDFFAEVRRFEIALIEQALRRTGGSQRRAAELLGMKPTTLHAKMKAYNLTAKKSEAGRQSLHRPRPAIHGAPA